MAVNDDEAPIEAPQSWDEVRRFRDLQTSGLLWLINATVFHPRGFALGMVPEEGDDGTGEYGGWVLLGDGSEPWHFDPEGTDELFAKAQETLAAAEQAAKTSP